MRAIILAISLSSLGGLGCGAAPQPVAPPQALAAAQPPNAEPQPSQQPAAPALLPVVLTADAHLVCTISSTDNGRQKLVITRGQGLEFDVSVSPIVDGIVETKGPEKGGSYRFTSHLATHGTGVLAGVGKVTLESLETKVNVTMVRYQQQQGAGTELRFTSTDMAARGIYVEFSGQAVAVNGDRYAFRVTLGAPTEGSGGSVEPATDADRAPIIAKSVRIVAPQTTVVTKTTLQKLP